MRGGYLVYWYLDATVAKHQSLVPELDKLGYDVRFFSSLSQLMGALYQQRSAIILIEDAHPPKTVEKAMLTLANMPELQGARLVLSVRRPHETLMNLASSLNFRDMIPLDLDADQWLRRFRFATAADALEFRPTVGQVSVNAMAQVSLPARVVWIGREKMRIESRLKPEVGMNLNIGGQLASEFGLRSFSFQVEEVDQSRLMYRFSDALVGRWSVPVSARSRVADVLSKIEDSDPGPRRRIFLAIQDTKVRNSLLTVFDDPRIEVKAALQKQGIANEPRYFDPDLVIIEDRLCAEQGGERFRTMISTVDDTVPILILGNRIHKDRIRQLCGDRRVAHLPRIPQHLANLVMTKYLPLSERRPQLDKDQEGFHIIAEDSRSFATVGLPARLTQVHPESAELAVPVKIGKFGTCRLDAPLLRQIVGRSPHAKILNVYPNPRSSSFNFLASVYLCDVDAQAREKLARSLVTHVEQQLGRYEGGAAGDSSPNERKGSRVFGAGAGRGTGTDGPLPRTAPEPEELDPDFEYEEVILPGERVSAVSRGLAFQLWQLLLQYRYLVLFIAFTSFASLLIWGTLNVLAPNYDKSGGQFTESLKKFSPYNKGWKKP